MTVALGIAAELFEKLRHVGRRRAFPEIAAREGEIRLQHARHLVDVLGYRTPALLDALLRPHLAAPPVQAALDLGCGTGLCATFLRPLARHVTGVDLSQRMLERARAAGTDSGITYRRADLEAFDPAGAEFDLVYSSLALHYVADLAGLLRRVKEALAPGAAPQPRPGSHA